MASLSCFWQCSTACGLFITFVPWFAGPGSPRTGGWVLPLTPLLSSPTLLYRQLTMILSLSNRLNTNYAPTPNEMRVLQRDLAEPNRKINIIGSQIQELNDTLRKLEKERDVLGFRVTTYKGFLSPARRLLPDILQEIFIHCLPTDSNSAMSTCEAPLLLGRICRKWRDVVYSTPSLWATIHIAVPPDAGSGIWHMYDHVSRAQAIVTWLSRSGVLPLSISLSTPFGLGPPENTVANSTVELYLDSIFPFLNRCRTLDLRCSNTIWVPFLQKCREVEFPFLQYLCIDGGHNFGVEGANDELKDAGFLEAPELRSVWLILYGSRVVQLPLPWGKLTEFNMCNLSSVWEPRKALTIPDALALLSWCPNLTFCSLPLSDVGTSYNLSSRESASMMARLQGLRGLTIQCDVNPRTFFAQLDIPSLCYFLYHQELPRSAELQLDGFDRSLHVALTPFIQRVVQPVEELQLFATYLTVRDIIACLELFPGLRRLSLLGSMALSSNWWDTVTRLYIGETILRRFMQRTIPVEDVVDETEVHDSPDSVDGTSDSEHGSEASSPCLCPKLDMFSCSGAFFSDETMLDFIRFRSLYHERNGVSHLRWINVKFTAGRDDRFGVMEELDKLRKQTGSFISVHYPGPDPISFTGHSPYDGLVTVDRAGVATHRYVQEFGSVLSREH